MFHVLFVSNMGLTKFIASLSVDVIQTGLLNVFFPKKGVQYLPNFYTRMVLNERYENPTFVEMDI